MATLTTGKTWVSGETVTPALLNQMVNSATIANIATSEISDDAVTAAKLSGVLDIAQKTSDYTLVLADAGRVLEVNSPNAVTITIPTNASVAFATGTQVAITRMGAGAVTVAAAGGVTLRSSDGRTKIAKQYSSAAVIKVATNEWLLVGLLSA